MKVLERGPRLRGPAPRRLTATGVKFAGTVVLLDGPTVLAFFSGGYFDEPRAWAGLAAWLLVLAAVLVAPRRLPRTRETWLALAGISLLACWTIASTAWAPLAGGAYHAGQLVALYTGALLAATLLLGGPRELRMVEPALATGAVVVLGYGLAGRFLPGALHYARSVTAQGRLEQPLTYWNATGELAALGLVLAARVAGDGRRTTTLRVLAAAACAPLGMGLYLTFSRGALFACVVGLLVLAAAAPARQQLEAVFVATGAAVLGAFAAAEFGGVVSLGGSLASRERQGLFALLILTAVACAAGVAQRTLVLRRQPSELQPRRYVLKVALVLSCVALLATIIAGGAEDTRRGVVVGPGRLVTLASNRYDFWHVALRAFAAEPLRGVGAGGWQVWWLRYRPFNGFAVDAHSLPLQTAAELGVIGLMFLVVFFAGVTLAARRVRRADPALGAGPLAALVVYAVHAPLDWDWQMPAVTLVAVVLAGALLASVESTAEGSVLDQRARCTGARRNQLISARSKVLGDPAEDRAS